MLNIKRYDRDILTIVLPNKDLDFVNSLRKIIISEVPTLAINETKIFVNTSSMPDEIIAHRLGLITLKSDILSKNKGEVAKDFTVEDGMVCLDVKCKDKDKLVVLSGMMKFDTEEISPINSDVPILTLSKGQCLKVHAAATVGMGKLNYKWSPVSRVWFNKVKNGYELSLESLGSLKPHIIISVAIGILSEKLNQ